MAPTRSALPLVVLAALFATTALAAEPAPRTLVLPLRSIGVSDTTVRVSHDLLTGSLQDLGVSVFVVSSGESPLPSGPDACDAPGCAAELGRQYGAGQVVYGSLSKLGTKIIARLSVVRVGETDPYYRDQLAATSEEDLDRVMRRFAEGIAAGKPSSDRASVESVTQQETQTPVRRATRAGFGVRAGFLFPTGNSFGGTDRMTNLRPVFRYEMRDYQIETTTLLGFTWGEGSLDWTMLDLNALRLFGTRDMASYLGLGVGVHTVTVDRPQLVTVDTGYGPPYTYSQSYTQTETAPTLDVIAGVMAMRTYDFTIVLDVRYHHVFDNFDKVGGKGAHGLLISFGTSR
jgi:hypothetical protein